MGDTGPCGPCTEIFYDHGENIWGGLPGSPEEDGDRFIEIWNVVFMQFNRTAEGEMLPLPAPSVDTGMGLERLAAVLQGVHANYEIDLFQNLLQASSIAIGCENSDQPSLRVVADHIRSCSFLVADGVLPSNEGRGYVLRRIIRRACRHGHKLGAEGSFFYKIVAALVKEMGDAFPELKEKQTQIEKALKHEEEQFAKTLDQGMKILEQDLAELKGKVIPGEVAFKLYDTFGFPFDLTADIARERDLSVDEAGFEKQMQAQRERARSASSFGLDYNSIINIDRPTEFTGYSKASDKAEVIALYLEGKPVESLAEGQKGLVILDTTPFYAEAGGQVGDTGQLLGKTQRFDVQDTTKAGEAFAHQGIVAEGSLKVGDQLTAQVDTRVRERTRRNHSATHLLHAALRQVLGDSVQQKGSLVDSERLRFDFSHNEALTAEQLQEISRLVNEQIRANAAVTTELLDLETAKKRGAMALFGEKYAEEVRVLSMGTKQGEQSFSIELCGGLHVVRTGDIALFHLTSESGVAAGVRRIEGITGEAALNFLQEREQQLLKAASQLKVKPEQLLERLETNQDRMRQLEKDLQQLKKKLASGGSTDLTSQVEEVAGVKVLAISIEGADVPTLRELMDQMKQKLAPAALVLAAIEGDKVSLIAGVSGAAKDQIHAGKLVNHVAQQVGGKGGGRPDMAQAGGTKPSSLPAALASVKAWVAEQLG